MEIIDPDHDLIDRIANGDIHAYRVLVKRHLDFCIRVSQRMVGNRADAEDIAQEVCLKIWKEAPRWQPKAKFTTWLYRVLINACIDHKRKIVPMVSDGLEQLIDEDLSIDDFIIERQQEKQVQKALEQLPERQRAAIILSYYEQCNNQEAADTMELSLGAFQQLLFRARNQLKETLMKKELEIQHG